jgi:hypothetical protein
MKTKAPFKIDLRRMSVRHCKADGLWVTKDCYEASYPYPGMESFAGSRHGIAANGSTPQAAKNRLIRQLVKDFGGYR